MLAPPIVHQIWMQGWDKRPAKFNENIDQLKAMNPEFQFLTWDEESIAIECKKLGSEFEEKYRSFSTMISKVDYGRYILLYNYGGISVDLDMKPLHPIRETPELDTYDFIVSGGAFPFGKLGMVNNAVLIVTANHPLLLKFIQQITDINVKESDYLTKELYVHNTTGPLVLSQFIKEHKGIHVLDHVFFEPCLSVDPYCKVPKKAIMDHQHELSWMSAFMKFLAKIGFFILYNWYFVLVFVLFLVFYQFDSYKQVRRR